MDDSNNTVKIERRGRPRKYQNEEEKKLAHRKTALEFYRKNKEALREKRYTHKPFQQISKEELYKLLVESIKNNEECSRNL